MADEGLRIFIWFFLALGRHRRGRNFQRLARAHVAGFATIDNVRFGHVDLDDLWVPVGSLLLQSVDLLRREIDHVVGDVVVEFRFRSGCRFEHIAELKAKLGSFVANFVVSFLELLKVEFFLAAVGELDCGLLSFVSVDFLLLAGLIGGAGAGFEFVSERIHIGAAVGENALYREQTSAGIVEFLTRLTRLISGGISGFLHCRRQLYILRVLLNVAL